MSFMVAQPAIRLPVPTLAMGALCPGVVVGALATLVWWSKSGDHGTAAMLGAGVAVATALAWVVTLALLPARPASHWSLIVVLGSSARMFVSLALALGLLLSIRPEPTPFWGSFLVTSLVTLVVETLVSISALKRAALGGPEDIAK